MVRKVFVQPLQRGRRGARGSIDAMVDALLLARTQAFVRHVSGPHPRSYFHGLAAALASPPWAGAIRR